MLRVVLSRESLWLYALQTKCFGPSPLIKIGGAKVDNRCISVVWLEGEGLLSFNQHKLLAVERGLRTFRPCLVTVFFDNMAAVSYLRRQGGTLAPALNAKDSALGGTVEHLSDAPVCSRSEQCGGGRLVSP